MQKWEQILLHTGIRQSRHKKFRRIKKLCSGDFIAPLFSRYWISNRAKSRSDMPGNILSRFLKHRNQSIPSYLRKKAGTDALGSYRNENKLTEGRLRAAWEYSTQCQKRKELWITWGRIVMKVLVQGEEERMMSSQNVVSLIFPFPKICGSQDSYQITFISVLQGLLGCPLASRH